MFQHPARYEAVVPREQTTQYVSPSGGRTLGVGVQLDSPTRFSIRNGSASPKSHVTYQRVQGGVVSSAYMTKSMDLPEVRTYGLPTMPIVNNTLHYGSSEDAQSSIRPASVGSYRSSTVASRNAHHTQLLPGNGSQFREFAIQEPRISPKKSATLPAATMNRSPSKQTISLDTLDTSTGHLPGYGGHCPNLQFTFGRSYGPVTATLLGNSPTNQLRRSQELEANQGF